MSKDLLAEATRALRESEDVSELEARATRTRVMTGLHQTRVRRRTRLAFLLPIAATFVAASAWGAASGQARRIFQSLEHWITPPLSNVPAPVPTLTNVPVPALTNVPVPVPVPVPALTNVPVPVPAPAPPLTLPHPTPSASSTTDPTLSLYRAAHQAHFVDHDPVRALAAWDAYLVAAPRGQFAPEAKYNRALTLVRLARNNEARSALEPFASGAYGAYRRAEASALLERLNQ